MATASVTGVPGPIKTIAGEQRGVPLAILPNPFGPGLPQDLWYVDVTVNLPGLGRLGCVRSSAGALA